MNQLMGKGPKRPAEGNNNMTRGKGEKYSYTVEVRHRVNPHINRQREMNRQFKIKAFKGLKEILMKKEDIDESLDSVNSDDYKDFAALEEERKNL